MSIIVGADGQKISSKEEEINYEVGGVRICVPKTPNDMLEIALSGARQIVGQQAGQAALERTKSHVAAQTEAQVAASRVGNPFQLEPGALALFMLMSREIEHRDRVIADLAKRLDSLDGKDSNELLKKPWPDPVMRGQENKDSQGNKN